MNKNQEVVFGSGCFWCVEAVFGRLKGVISVTPGYAGGAKENPTYEEVCSGKTGHAEVVRVEYDSEVISYGELLKVFFATHNPTTKDRQGADVGTQYRSIILYTTEEQKNETTLMIKKLKTSGLNVVTEVEPLINFYEATEDQKSYYEKNTSAPYCQVVISPKIEKVKEKFGNLLKSSI